jgi:hypothetical protein
MTTEFEISFEWLARDHGDAVDRATFAELGIRVDGEVATRVEDVAARTVRDSIRVSTYPLACWLAANWWRLRWESESHVPDWRMSHQVGAAGGGYAWPDLTFSCDGEVMQVSSRPTDVSAIEPVRYLSRFDVLLPAESFEIGIDRFLDGVMERLDCFRLRGSELAGLWQTVREERGDTEVSAWRRLEARLGFDPDEAPEDLMKTLQERIADLGGGAVDEVASASGGQAAEHLSLLEGEVRTKAVAIRVPGSERLRTEGGALANTRQPPWRAAAQAARQVRECWSLGIEPLPNRQRADIFSMPEGVLEDESLEVVAPMSAGFRGIPEGDQLEIFLNKPRSTSRRFALARLVADHIYRSAGDRLLPATDARTARQKFQRAFAQEFLCPFTALSDFLGSTEPTDDRIEEAADLFNVSPLLVKTTLVNRGVLGREVLPD